MKNLASKVAPLAPTLTLPQGGREQSATLTRRTCLLAAPALAAQMLLTAPAHAGAQIEEPLADSVRTALHAAITNSAPPASM